MNLAHRQLPRLFGQRWASSYTSKRIPVTVEEFAPMAFYALDRPLLALHSQEHSSRTTTTITLDIRQGQVQVASCDGLEQDQVADYLVAMQQRWEDEQKKTHGKKKKSLLKKGFFEKN